MNNLISLTMYFDGNAREAMEFYGHIFGEHNKSVMTYSEVPGDSMFTGDDEYNDLIVHGELSIHGLPIYFSDVLPNSDDEYKVGNHISITVSLNDGEELSREFDELSKEGKVHMELQPVFFAKKYGKLTDKYGVDWELFEDE